MKNIFLLLICTLLISCTSKQTTNIEKTTNFTFNRLNTISVPFITNEGQISKEVSYYANIIDGYIFVIDNGELVYSFKVQGVEDIAINLSESFTGSNETMIIGESESITKVNYIKGNDPVKWKSNISTYDTVDMGEIYDGIGLKLKAYNRNVEKIFTVDPGIKPDKIQINVKGIETAKVNANGELELITSVGTIVFTKPIAYQFINGQRQDVKVSYTILDNCNQGEYNYGFIVGNYNLDFELIIDPMIASTLFGGIDHDGWDSYAHLDSEGNIVVYSRTYSPNLPTTPGAYDETFNGDWCDVYISRFNPDLTELLASTYIGGSDNEFEGEFDISSDGNIYITGRTKSDDYPITPNAYDQIFNSGLLSDFFEIYVSCLSADLTTLLYSTYLGTHNGDYGDCIILDSNDNVYITGHTRNSDFPTTPGAYDETFNTVINAGDAYVSKFDTTLSNLLASTYLGGGRYDRGYSLVFDENEDLYIAGRTDSPGFPTTPNAYLPEQAWAYDFFISKMDNNLTTLYTSTYLGGEDGFEEIPKIKLGSDNCIYLTGTTGSDDYPTTPGAYITSFGGAAGSSDGVVSKLNADLSELLASSYIGHWYYDYCFAIHVDDDLNVYVGGATDEAEFLAHPNGWLTTLDGRDAFIVKLNSELSERIAGTFYGGSESDYVTHIIEDMNGNILTTGIAISPDFPTTPGAYDESHNGSYDQFITIFDPWLSGDTDISEHEISPGNVVLHNSYPNPFSISGSTSGTILRFDLKINCHVALDIYNIEGQKIKSLLYESFNAGTHYVTWNGKDNFGNKVAAGIYFCKLKADDYKKVKKMILIK
ncbi:MAG: SBBP repeat-containing protein [Candidatus Cloacimonetes bacterium]|nr:SBBP repeat-containing protein [Candidatus Cloacimonadota bacterium]